MNQIVANESFIGLRLGEDTFTTNILIRLKLSTIIYKRRGKTLSTVITLNFRGFWSDRGLFGFGFGSTVFLAQLEAVLLVA